MDSIFEYILFYGGIMFIILMIGIPFVLTCTLGIVLVEWCGLDGWLWWIFLLIFYVESSLVIGVLLC